MSSYKAIVCWLKCCVIYELLQSDSLLAKITVRSLFFFWVSFETDISRFYLNREKQPSCPILGRWRFEDNFFLYSPLLLYLLPEVIPKDWLSIAIEGGLRQRCCRLDHIVWFKTVEKNESTVRLEGFALIYILAIMVCFVVEYDYDYDSFCFRNASIYLCRSGNRTIEHHELN